MALASHDPMTSHLSKFATLALLCFVQVSWAAKPLAPSWRRMMCEKALMSAGLWDPPVRATVHSPPLFRYYHKMGVVKVANGSGHATTMYNRTDRDRYELNRQAFYPMAYFRLANLEGLKVLDLACGDGRLVEELRRKGINIVGLDVFLNRYQLSKPYYIQAGAAVTGIDDASLDLVVSTQGPLSFEDKTAGERILLEIRRILKPGGRLLVSSLYNADNANLDDTRPSVWLKNTAFENLPPGLRIKTAPDRWWLLHAAENTDERHANYWLEIERTRTD